MSRQGEDLRRAFDETLPRSRPRLKSNIQSAVATMSQTHRGGDLVSFPPSRTPLETAAAPEEARLSGARKQEMRLQNEASYARAELKQVSAEVNIALEKLTTSRAQLLRKQARLDTLILRIQSLEERLAAAQSAREALEALKSHGRRRTDSV